MKYLATLFLSGCAFLSGPCYIMVDLESRAAVCEIGGRMIVMPANVLKIDSEGINFRK
jgi:hypothetical protein